MATAAIEFAFGPGRSWSSGKMVASVWEMSGFHLLWTGGGNGEAALGRLWKAYRGKRPYNVVLLASGANEGQLRVAGPSAALPVRDMPSAAVLRLLGETRDLDDHSAARLLAREFIRLAAAAAPGVHVRDLLTPHFVASRLLPRHGDNLAAALADAADRGGADWRGLFERLGYAIKDTGASSTYLLHYDGAPIAVVRPYADPSAFGRLDEHGAPPAGVLLAACRNTGAAWGVLAAGGRYRLFEADPEAGSATARYLELDAADLEDRRYLGLLAPAALRKDGWFGAWIGQARDFGEKLSRDLRERIIGKALPAIAQGLCAHRGHDDLQQIEAATRTLVFRAMFLLHTEARGYLPVHTAAYRRRSATDLAREARDGLGSHDRHSTLLWDRLQTLVRLIRNGNSRIGVPAYNGRLFATGGFPGSELLEGAAVTDDRLADALTAIAFESDEPGRPGLDYAGLDVSHLGSIYEELLSFRLAIASEDLAYDTASDLYRPLRAGEQAVVTGGDPYWQSEAGGRKASGVFYTRREFVRHLLRHSLEPALEEHLERVREEAKRDPDAAARRLFDFTVIDPAMGSGHFLTEALDMTADRMAEFLAETPGGLRAVRGLLDELREEGGGGAAEDGDLLRRLVLKRCIYGVDLSPMAVEVANVTLWLASFVPGLALSWLGGNLKAGDALIGVADPSVVGAADSPLFTGTHVRAAMERAATLQRELAAVPDRTPDEVRLSEQRGAELREATAGLRDAFDLWAADPLGPGSARAALELNAEDIANGKADAVAPKEINEARRIANDFRFFHWPIEFPHVFDRDRPGFDVVAGNPPWNEVTVEELGFYALRDPGLRGLSSLAEQRRGIAAMDRSQPQLRAEFEADRKRLKTMRAFFSERGGYRLQGGGDTDLYQLFCERYTHLLREDGRLGVVLPRSAFLADGARRFREWLFARNRLRRVDVLTNKKQWAFGIHPRYTIALLSGQRREPESDAHFVFSGPSASTVEFEAAGEGVKMSVAALGSALAVPLTPTQQHADILARMRRGPVVSDMVSPEIQKNQRGGAAASRLVPYTELHETQQRRLFSRHQGMPVWKGRSFDQYDPHGRGPAGFCDWDEVLDFVQGKRARSAPLKLLFAAERLAATAAHPIHGARVAFRDVTNRTNSRTVIACLVPPRTPLTNKAPYLVFTDDWQPIDRMTVLGVMNSIPFDWQVRRYVETNMNFFILNMLCFPRWEDTDWRRIGELAARLSCADERFEAFAAEAGVEWGPLGEEEREEMRAEIDALAARGYGLGADELRFLFGDFTEKAVTPRYRERVLAAFGGLA